MRLDRSSTIDTSAQRKLEALSASSSRVLWQVVLPGLVAALALRYAVPTSAEARHGWAAPLAALNDEHPLGLGLGLFVALAASAQYWAGRISNSTTAQAQRRTRAMLISVAVAIVAAVTIRGVFLGSYTVLGASMLPTLEPGDLVAGNRRAYGSRIADREPGRAPGRGDIVVFAAPPSAGTLPEGTASRLVKRVIGLPGDKITMNGPHPVINGWEVPSCDAGPYLYPVGENAIAGRLVVEFLGDRAYLALFVPISEFWNETFEVKPGEVFVLGDNRGNSSDSRAWNEGKGGALPFQSVEARVTWWVSGMERDGRMDFDRFLKPLDLDVRLDGLDTSILRAGIRHCLDTRPSNTTPPRAP